MRKINQKHIYNNIWLSLSHLVALWQTKCSIIWEYSISESSFFIYIIIIIYTHTHTHIYIIIIIIYIYIYIHTHNVYKFRMCVKKIIISAKIFRKKFKRELYNRCNFIYFNYIKESGLFLYCILSSSFLSHSSRLPSSLISPTLSFVNTSQLATHTQLIKKILNHHPNF